ncbi:glycosyltransferase family 2 protein [Nocardioides pantholopis]|uniref:glycosyltransferase family 2 protein n=1 Tax=Nocardioides pantholopis TaxID=2483798 RepID=UPI0013DE0C2F|nr:glycosyltransferase family 2 protein [Nocardioides pantholopis]
MTGTLRAALVTVTFNSREDLATHWKNAAQLALPWLVVDNASTDGSADLARQMGAADVVELAANMGFSAANNLAAGLVNAECYIFANPDVEVDSDSALRLANYAIEHGVIAAPQLLNLDGSPQENGRTDPYLYRKVVHFLGGRISRASGYEVRAEPSEVVSVDWAIGAALAIPRPILEALGGWDSKFFIYYEDSDICLRARQLGFETRLIGDVRWVHAWARSTRKKISLNSWKFEFRSATRFYARYPRLLGHPRLSDLRSRLSAVFGAA